MRTRQILCKYCFRITCIFYFVLFYAKTMRPSVKRAYSHISMQWYRKQDVMRAFSAGSFDYKVVSGADIHFLIEKQWIYFLNVWNKPSNGNDNDKKHFGLKSKMSAVVTEFGVHETKHGEKNNRFFFGWIIEKLKRFKKNNGDKYVMNIFMWIFWIVYYIYMNYINNIPLIIFLKNSKVIP